MANKLQYSEQQMLSALEAVRNGTSIAAASKLNEVPRTTLSDKYHGKVPIERKMGPEAILSPEEESQLVQWMFDVAAIGFPVTKDQLSDSVKLLLIELNKSSLFPNGRPGRTWFESFLKRHPEVSKRVPQNLTKSRGVITEEQLRGWFKEVLDYFTANLYLSILLDPRRIFNCDETAFFLCPKGAHVLVRRGEKSVYNFINCNEKECLTTLITGNAAGDLAPPMIVFSYKRVPADIAASLPKKWGLGTSENGWMTGETFYEFISSIFYPWILKEKIPLPVILFLDGHSSHLTMKVSKFCRDHHIILVALHPNGTHILQPLDVAVFSSLKKEWKTTVQNWRMENGGERMTRKHFAPLLEATINKCNFQQSLQNGFRACGLHPFNPDAIDYSKLLQPRRSMSTSSSNVEDIQHHLQFIEKNLPSEKVDFFKSSGCLWSGNVEDKTMFNFWLSLKRRIVDIEDNQTERHVTQGEVEENQTEEQEMEEEYTENRVEMVQSQATEEEIQELTVEEIGHQFQLEENQLTQEEISEAPILIAVESHIPPASTTASADSENAEQDSTKKSGISSSNGNKVQARKSVEENLNENDKNYLNTLNRRDIPSPFRKALPWPGLKAQKRNLKAQTHQNRQPKEKLPAVATGEEWVKYHERKEERKQLLLLEAEQKKKERARKAEEKRIALEANREERLRKKQEKAEIKRVALMIKQEKKEIKQKAKGKRSKIIIENK